MTPIIEVSEFTKVYEKTAAVTDLSFQVQPGDVLGLVGPNGAGKTTTIRAIAGIITPTRGRITINGISLAQDPVGAKRHLAYVPDEPRLFDELTVMEHLRFFGSVFDVPDVDARAAPLLEQFDLTPHAGKLAQELSRGMRQKVAACCAYLHDPRLIVLDEPLTGLDPRGIRTMTDSIRARAASGTSFIISSHLLNLVEDLCTSLLIIHQGKSRYFGPMSGVRSAFEGASADDSLEELFMRATEDGHRPITAREPTPGSAIGPASGE